jgi:NAD(P)-dependent dehydrogenase (short-subunit alcohol dehydrogenase family)
LLSVPRIIRALAIALDCCAVNDKQILITGATNGIGLAAAEALAALGANLVIVGRSQTRMRIASARIRSAAGRGATVATFIADLSSQASVRRLVLLHRLKESAPARIITTASQAHQGTHIPFDDLDAERSYRGFGRYGETKLANILFTTELARRLDGTGVTANCFHPGLVATEFNRNNGLLMGLAMTVLRPVSRSPEKGAETLVWLATSPDIANVSGRYFFDQEQRPPSPEAQDAETARRLWEISERQCMVSGRSAEARS